MSARTSYSIADLADAAGVSRRTVRFYVQRELLPPPEGLGRGARYTDAHLARLLQIKGWQEQGVALDEIRARLGSLPLGARARWPSGASHVLGEATLAVQRRKAPEPGVGSMDAPGTSWFRQPLIAGFELHVAAGRPPLSAHQLALLARALGEIVDKEGEEE